MSGRKATQADDEDFIMNSVLAKYLIQLVDNQAKWMQYILDDERQWRNHDAAEENKKHLEQFRKQLWEQL